MTIILGIETSCDETAAAVVCDGRRILANTIASQHDLHERFGGVVPEIASRAHVERILPIVREALCEAGATLDEIDAIAVGNRPGLIGSLLVGVAAAKGLAWSLNVPLLGVDHVRAHLYSAAMGNGPPQYPALGLVVSGGHTSLYRVDAPLEMRLLGRTIDDAVGEAYDKAAMILDIGYPGGPRLDRLAQTGDPRRYSLPRSMLDKTSLNFSFSGLKTALLYAVRGKPRGRDRNGVVQFDRAARDLSPEERADLAASFQDAAIGALVNKVVRAYEQWPEDRKPRTLLVGGGVSANSLLRKEMTDLETGLGLDVRIPPMDLCLDNAAMIAGLAYHHLQTGDLADYALPAVATTSLQ